MKKIKLLSLFFLLCYVPVVKAADAVASIILSDPFIENGISHVFKPNDPNDEPYTICQIKHNQD